MAALEQVIKMREQGMSERQIIDSLKNQGINPKDINDALSQSQIKSAIDTTNPEQINPPSMPIQQQAPYEELGFPQSQTPQLPPPPTNPMNQEPTINQMQHSIMSQEPSQSSIPNPSPIQNQPPQFQQPEVIQPPTDFTQPATEYQPPESYQEQYPEYEYQQSMDVETITEIAEQVVEEKVEKMKKQTSSLIRVKEELSIKVEKINQRLEKIENLFNELQIAILGKIKDYSHDLRGLSSELHATQESFSKVLNPIIDQQRENPQEQTQPQISKTRGRQKKDTEDFEKYLR